MKLNNIEATGIPAGYYFNKSQAANILNIPTGTLQWHIERGNIQTIKFPNLGHLIERSDIEKFKKVLKSIRPGKPTIYPKNLAWSSMHGQSGES